MVSNLIKGYGLIIGSSKLFDKRYGLLFISLVLWSWMGYSILSHSTKHIIQATIIQSAQPIRSIDDPVVPTKKEIMWFDKLYFPKSVELYHPSYGYLGYRHDFVIYFNTVFHIDKKKKIRFVVYSDDGFRLFLDGKKIMEYARDRPFSKSEKEVTVSPGIHKIYMKYFQGYGQLGVAVYYEDGTRYHLVGESSCDVVFYKK